MHFDAFSFKKFSEVNLETAEICSSRETASDVISMEKTTCIVVIHREPQGEPMELFQEGVHDQKEQTRREYRSLAYAPFLLEGCGQILIESYLTAAIVIPVVQQTPCF